METPKGFRTYLFEQSENKRKIEKKLLDLFLGRGYLEIIPPMIEFYETLSVAPTDTSLNQVFKFTDRHTGKIIALRPDITPQVARTVSLHMKNLPKPIRLCYCGNVFRHAEPRSGGRQEMTQVGVELIGEKGAEADAEIISIAVDAMKAAGFEDFKMVIGQVEFFKGIISCAGLKPGDEEEVKKIIQKKDLSTLSAFLTEKGVSKGASERLYELPSLIGGLDVVDRASRMSGDTVSKSALENLKDVVRILKSRNLEENILIDLGEVRGLDYYTGICFEGFIKGIGREVCGGGRYDSLLASYGEASPATGFAIEVDSLLEKIEST
ncbi:MAG: ATP phosphoribosyltransferase regulatory subunit [Nitrospinota bacterium]